MFQLMGALEFTTGHLVYTLSYNYILQAKEIHVFLFWNFKSDMHWRLYLRFRNDHKFNLLNLVSSLILKANAVFHLSPPNSFWGIISWKCNCIKMLFHKEFQLIVILWLLLASCNNVGGYFPIWRAASRLLKTDATHIFQFDKIFLLTYMIKFSFMSFASCK